MIARHRQGNRGFLSQLRRDADAARGAARALPQPAGQRLRAASRWAWPPTSRRTTWARSSMASCHMIDHPDCTVEDLMQFIKGPDFPTGADDLGQERHPRGLPHRPGPHHRARQNGYRTHGAMAATASWSRKFPTWSTRRAWWKKSPNWCMKSAWKAFPISAMNPTGSGMRIVIELKKDVNANVVLNFLYKHTQLQDTFGAIMLALVNGEPKYLSLQRNDPALYRSPERRDRAPHALRPQQGRGPRAHLGRTAHRARPHRRGHRADPRLPYRRRKPEMA